MRKSRVASLLLETFILGSVGASFSEERVPPGEVAKYDGTPYASGGVGQAEREVLQRMAKNFNVKLIFTEGRAFLGETQVTIQDESGKKVLEAVAEGPWLLTRLPAGTYKVTATTMGKALEQTARVRDAGPTQLHFSW